MAGSSCVGSSAACISFMKKRSDILPVSFKMLHKAMCQSPMFVVCLPPYSDIYMLNCTECFQLHSGL